MKKSSLSAGLVIYEVLNETPEISGAVTKIFPVMTDSATLPYICYRRASVDPSQIKGSSNDHAQIEILCMSAGYAEGVNLAEEVRSALDCKHIIGDCGLTINICTMIDASETWAEDAFVQSLVFDMEVLPVKQENS